MLSFVLAYEFLSRFGIRQLAFPISNDPVIHLFVSVIGVDPVTTDPIANALILRTWPAGDRLSSV